MLNIKLKKIVWLMTACCLLAGCEKKNDNSSNSPDTNVTDVMTTTDSETTMDAEITTDTEATTDSISENTQNMDIPEDAVLKITETTYRNDEVWETIIKYKNNHDDIVAWGYVQSDGKEVLLSRHEYKYDDNGKKIYTKTISDTGEYSETEYRDNVEKTKSYDGGGRLEGEGEAIFDKYGNYIKSHTIIYDINGPEGTVSLEMSEDYSDCDYDENGKILVCRERSETGEIISTTTNTYDVNGNMLLSEKISPDSEEFYCICHTYEYDDKNNLIAEEDITKSNTDTVRVTASYEYRYDENSRKVRQDHTYVDIDTDLNISEYTIYEYTEL